MTQFWLSHHIDPKDFFSDKTQSIVITVYSDILWNQREGKFFFVIKDFV